MKSLKTMINEVKKINNPVIEASTIIQTININKASDEDLESLSKAIKTWNKYKLKLTPSELSYMSAVGGSNNSVFDTGSTFYDQQSRKMADKLVSKGALTKSRGGSYKWADPFYSLLAKKIFLSAYVREKTGIKASSWNKWT